MPISLDKLQTAIQGSKFTSDQQKWLLGMVSKYGEHTRQMICKEVYSEDFELEKDDLFQAVQTCVLAVEQARQGSMNGLVDVFKSLSNSNNFDFNRFALAVLLDAKRVPGFVQKLSPVVIDYFNDFEKEMFRFLPHDELVMLVAGNILYFVAQLNIVMEFKRLYFVPSLSDQTEWAQPFRPALEANQETIGTKNIMVGDKPVPPTVGNWIKDYIVFLPNALAERGGYGQVKYLEQSPNVKSLSPEEKKLLSEVLRLYAWFVEPDVTEEELDAYDAELARKEREELGQSKPEPKPMADIAPAPKPAPVMEPSPGITFAPASAPAPVMAPASAAKGATLEDIKRGIEEQKRLAEGMIDQKLEELKQKVI